MRILYCDGFYENIKLTRYKENLILIVHKETRFINFKTMIFI